MSHMFSPVTAGAPLRIDTSCPTPATVRATVAGEVDMSTAPRLRVSLLAVVHEQSPEILDVDLAGVTFLDCAGVHALVGIRNAAAHIGCQVWVTRPHRVVGRVLALTGVLDVLTAPLAPAQPPDARAEDLPGTELAPGSVTRPSPVAVAV